jgi:hypothetical protein
MYTTNMNQASAVLTSMALSIGIMLGQVASPKAGLTYLGLIPVPNWATSGPNQEATDLSSFNPVTQVLYYVDRASHGVIAIDTRTNSILGWIQAPNCNCVGTLLAIP